MPKKQLLLGAHMSIAGGVEKAIYRGSSIGCTAIQLFTESNRRWSFKRFEQHQIELFKQAEKETGLTHVMAHASYLINMGSTSKATLEKSAHALLEELNRCEQLAIPYLVLHPGSGLTPAADCLKQVAQNVEAVLKHHTGSTMILFENMAGQGTSIGHTFEQLAFLRKSIKDKRIGFCFDTCHGWAAGYDFSTEKSYDSMWQSFDKVVGLKHLKAIHVNNSQKGLGSRVDRHEDIDKGTIPLEAFRLLFNDPAFFSIPKVLETPSGKEHETGLANYLRNMNVLRDLLTTKTREVLNI